MINIRINISSSNNNRNVCNNVIIAMFSIILHYINNYISKLNINNTTIITLVIFDIIFYSRILFFIYSIIRVVIFTHKVGDFHLW